MEIEIINNNFQVKNLFKWKRNNKTKKNVGFEKKYK